MKKIKTYVDWNLGNGGFNFYLLPTIQVTYDENDIIGEYEFLGYTKMSFKWLFLKVEFSRENNARTDMVATTRLNRFLNRKRKGINK